MQEVQRPQVVVDSELARRWRGSPPCSSWRRASLFDVTSPVVTSRSTTSAELGRPGSTAPRRRASRAPPIDARSGSPPNSTSAASPAARAASAPWTIVVTSSASARWPPRRSGAAACVGEDARSISAHRPQRELRELLDELGVVELHPVLVELVRRGLGRVEPQPGAGGLAQLGAVGAGQQRPGQGVHAHPPRAPDQVDAGRRCCPTGRNHRSAARTRGGRAATGSRSPAAACSENSV